MEERWRVRGDKYNGMAFGKRPSEECETCPMINRGPVRYVSYIRWRKESVHVRERERRRELLLENLFLG